MCKNVTGNVKENRRSHKKILQRGDELCFDPPFGSHPFCSKRFFARTFGFLKEGDGFSGLWALSVNIENPFHEKFTNLVHEDV